jgi:hypothetical protein
MAMLEMIFGLILFIIPFNLSMIKWIIVVVASPHVTTIIVQPMCFHTIEID